MSRVVIDTNIIVSALLAPAGMQAAVLLLALQGHVELYVSSPVLAQADYLVTGNTRHFPQGHKTTLVVTGRQFLEHHQSQESD